MAPTSALGGKSSTFNAAINLAKVLLFFSVLFFKASVFHSLGDFSIVYVLEFLLYRMPQNKVVYFFPQL